MNINEFSDDIRQVMEVLRNQPEVTHQINAEGRVESKPAQDGRPAETMPAPSAPHFNLASEVTTETYRYFHAFNFTDSSHTKRLDLLQADLESLMAVDMDAVIERVVKARNAALVKGVARG